MVSVVVPDFETTTKTLGLLSFFNRRLKRRTSNVSAKKSFLSPRPGSGQAPRSAFQTAKVPKLEPPIPITTTFSKPLARYWSANLPIFAIPESSNGSFQKISAWVFFSSSMYFKSFRGAESRSLFIETSSPALLRF